MNPNRQATEPYGEGEDRDLQALQRHRARPLSVGECSMIGSGDLGLPYGTPSPCFGKCDGCDKREYPSQEELDAYEKETEVAIQAAIALDNAMSSGESSGSFTHEGLRRHDQLGSPGPLSARGEVRHLRMERNLARATS